METTLDELMYIIAAKEVALTQSNREKNRLAQRVEVLEQELTLLREEKAEKGI